MNFIESDLVKKSSIYPDSAWNNTQKEFPLVCIHNLFEQIALQQPKKIAVTYLNEQICYRELDEKANHMAITLIKLGVSHETLIGLRIEKSIELIISILAILKTGATCVPLSPTYPDNQIKMIIKDANVRNVLTRKKSTSSFQFEPGINIFSVEELLANSYLDKISSVHVHMESLAYVFYTSGSTGKPKGVQVTHEGIVNHMSWMKEKYFQAYEPVVLQRSSCGFDASLWEIFLPLICGGRLVMMPEEGVNSLNYLLEVVKKERINTLELTPSMLSLLLETDFFSCNSLIRIFSSSEFLYSSIYNKFIKKSNQVKLSVLYGPTEVTIDVTSYDCVKERYSSSIPIGKPIANTKIYILDENFNQVPIGEVGEIYISGAGLARGYSSPGLTAEKFIPNPFGSESNRYSRLYKTGDLGSYLQDGNILFLGRIDRQIKLRGFRIELEEIENAILSSKEVQQVVVIECKKEDASSNYLIAYYTSGSGKSEETVKNELIDKVPTYMMPNRFVLLEKFPLNNSGKIDLKALSKMDQNKFKKDYMCPRNNKEALICRIWEKILGIEKIGIEEDFFHLGGNSLMALSIALQMTLTFSVPFSADDIYLFPTVKNSYNLLSKKEIAKSEKCIEIETHESLDVLIAAEEEKLFDFKKIDKAIETPYGVVWTQYVYTNEGENSTPVILSHAGPSGSHDALRHLLPIAKNRPLLFFDHLCGGRSDTPAPSEVKEFNMFVEALAVIIDSYNFDSYYLFGDCLGCTVVMKYLTTYKNRAKGLVLASPSVSEALHDEDLIQTSKRLPKETQEVINFHIKNDIYNSPEIIAARRAFCERFVLPKNKFTNYLKKSYLYINSEICDRMEGGKGMFFPTEGSLKGVDISDVLDKISVPVLITFGENDFVMNKHKKMLDKIKDRTIITFKDCAHWPLIEKNKDYIKLLNNWLKQKDREGKHV